MKRLATAALVIGAVCALWPTAARADIGGGPTGSNVCPGGTAGWTGTRTAPTTYTVTSSADIQCYSPQVNVTAGDTQHSYSYGSPQPTGPCSATATSRMSIGPLLGGKRVVSYWDPNSQTVTSTSVSDTAAAGAQNGFFTDAPTLPVLFAAWWMGSDAGTIPWKTKDATWVNGVCTGTWEQSLPGSCGYVGPVSYQCSDTAAVAPVLPLTFTQPPPVTVAPLLAQAEAQVKQELSGGQVTSEFASGSVVPKHGLIVRVPVCFWAQGATLDTTKSFGLVDPQLGPGRALVVNYVASASEDQTWWDFGDGSSATQTGVDPTQQCAVTHTYYRVSADAYGSLHNHTSPAGQTYPFPDAEPGPDQEAVVVWHHIHFSLSAYYVQSDGSQVKVDLPGVGGTDFWVPSQPEWVKVQQIESVPFVCPCPGAQ
jgi:hypothetical protein